MADEAFPYFTSLHANDCYTYQDFDIPIGVGEGKGFRHLILTGKNDSGKTTILQGINEWGEFAKEREGEPDYNAAMGNIYVSPTYKKTESLTERFDKRNSFYKFFDNLESVFQEVFEDKKLQLVFAREQYEFYLQYTAIGSGTKKGNRPIATPTKMAARRRNRK